VASAVLLALGLLWEYVLFWSQNFTEQISPSTPEDNISHHNPKNHRIALTGAAAAPPFFFEKLATYNH